jgi:hypothetical protein
VRRPLMDPREQGAALLQQRSSYRHAVEVAGGLPLLIPPLAEDTLHGVLERLDGIVFPGGADVEPATCGEAREPRTDVVGELVETHEPSQRLFSAFVEACRARIAVPATSLR